MSMRYSIQQSIPLKNLQYEGVKKVLLADHDTRGRWCKCALVNVSGGQAANPQLESN